MRTLSAFTSGDSVSRSRDERALGSLVGPLWETVARVADGRSPDDEDRSVLTSAQAALEGQLEMRKYMRGPKEAAPPPRSQRGTDTFVDLIWLAAEQLVVSGASHMSPLQHDGGGFALALQLGSHPPENEAAVEVATSLVTRPRDEGIARLIQDMTAIADGDRAVAQAYDPLFARVALLAESSSSNTLLQY